jgi:hypothetical protein
MKNMLPNDFMINHRVCEIARKCVLETVLLILKYIEYGNRFSHDQILQENSKISDAVLYKTIKLMLLSVKPHAKPILYKIRKDRRFLYSFNLEFTDSKLNDIVANAEQYTKSLLEFNEVIYGNSDCNDYIKILYQIVYVTIKENKRIRNTDLDDLLNEHYSVPREIIPVALDFLVSKSVLHKTGSKYQYYRVNDDVGYRDHINTDIIDILVPIHIPTRAEKKRKTQGGNIKLIQSK